MGYTLTPKLKAALRALPLHRRIATRWRLHKRLSALSRTDEAICYLFNTYDCGASLIDHITQGRLTRLQRERDERVAAVAEITQPLMGVGPDVEVPRIS